MKKRVWFIFVFLFLINIVYAQESQDCSDYCSRNVMYSQGTYNSRTSSCTYDLVSRCDYGCDTPTSCTSAPEITTENSQQPSPERMPQQIPSRTPQPTPARTPQQVPSWTPQPTPARTPSTPQIPQRYIPDKDGDGINDYNDPCIDTPGDNITGCPACQIDTDGTDLTTAGKIGFFKSAMKIGSDGLPQTTIYPAYFAQDACNGNILSEYSCTASNCLSAKQLAPFFGTGAFDGSLYAELTSAQCVLNPYSGKGISTVKSVTCQCGCSQGVCLPELDTDKDGILDCKDSDIDNDGIPNNKDNCPTVSNFDQKNTDNDSWGDACDDDIDNDGCSNAKDKWPTLKSGDTDKDGIPDDCDKCALDPKNDEDADSICGNKDNCPTVANPNQKDNNNDKIGDSCDCYDSFQGPAENGIDCGGPCSPCVTCTWCNTAKVTPLRIKGQWNKGYIDIVFAPDQNYAGNIAQFQKDAQNIIANWYLKLDTLMNSTPPQGYKDKFNFYIYTAGFGKNATCSSGQVKPPNLDKDVPYYDVAAILAPPGSGVFGFACSLGTPSYFITLGQKGDLVTHETGHALFGLVDEYYGNTYYTQNNPLPNVWSSSAACQKDALQQKWKLGNCRSINNGQGIINSYWRYDPDTPQASLDAFMTCCPHAPPYKFWEAESRRIVNTFATWPSSKTRGVLVNLQLTNNEITLRSAEIIDAHPDMGLQQGQFTVDAIDSNGQILNSFQLWDPRIQISHPAIISEDANFDIRLPLYTGLDSLHITEQKPGKTVGIIDLKTVVNTFCQEHSDVPECADIAQEIPHSKESPIVSQQPVGVVQNTKTFLLTLWRNTHSS